jgi:hypothetical protein
MKRIRLVIFIAIGVLFSSCNKNIEKVCFKNYPNKSEFDRKPIFSIDSTITSNSDCLHYTSDLIRLADSSTSVKQVLMFKNNKIFAKLVDHKSNEFILFDLDSKINQKREIEILYLDKQKIFTSTLEKRIITRDNIQVYVFRINNWADYYEAYFDTMFFVTKEYGVIGSFITDVEEDGTKSMIAPAGEILKEYIDYSKFAIRRLL